MATTAEKPTGHTLFGGVAMAPAEKPIPCSVAPLVLRLTTMSSFFSCMSEVKLQVTAAVPPLSTDGMEHVMAACEGTEEQVTDRVIDWLIDCFKSSKP